MYEIELPGLPKSFVSPDDLAKFNPVFLGDSSKGEASGSNSQGDITKVKRGKK